MSLLRRPPFARARLRTYAVILLFTFIFVTTFAATSSASGSAGDMELSALIREGLLKNPRIIALRHEWKRIEQRFPQARALPDPVLSYTYPIRKIETRLGPTEHVFGVSQRIPFPGKLRLKGDIANKEIQMARLEIESAAFDLALSIKLSFYELYYIDKAVGFARERLNVLSHFTKAEMNNYSVGSSGLDSVVRAEAEYADASYELILLEELRRAESTKLNTLLGRDPEEVVGPVGELEFRESPVTLDKLYEATFGNESIEMAGLKVETRELQMKLARFKALPNFSVGLNYTVIGKPEMSGVKDAGRDGVAVMVGLSVPLWARKNVAAVREARHARARSISEKTAIANELKNMIKKTYVDMTSNYKLIRLYSDTLLPKAVRLIDVSRIKYKNGQGTISELFEAQNMWINFKLAEYRARANYLKKVAEVERIAGDDLMRQQLIRRTTKDG
ncbi:MAG: TolC family protein [Thermodesulfobacteriota bacterium]